MAEFDRKAVGKVLVAVSVMLIAILVVVKLDLDAQGAFLCEVVADDPNLDMQACPAHQDNTSWLVFAAFGIAFLIFATGAYLVLEPSQERKEVRVEKVRIVEKDAKREPREVDLSKLAGDERRIYDLLKGSGGSAFQSALIKQAGFSKVKISRILDRLESKEIVERRRRGMANIVLLK